jgi:hypothetical protein
VSDAYWLSSVSGTANVTILFITGTALFYTAYTTVPDTYATVSDTYILIQNQVAVLHLKEIDSLSLLYKLGL